MEIGILIFLSVTILDLCIMFSFLLSICPCTMKRAVYCSSLVPSCLKHKTNRPPRIFALLERCFESTYSNSLLANRPLVTF